MKHGAWKAKQRGMGGLGVTGFVLVLLVILGTWGCGSSGGGGGEPAVDTTPDAFSFTAVTDADVDVPVYSDEITVAGIDEETAIAISGGDGAYSINGGMFTSEDGTVLEGDTVVVRLTASRYSNTVVAADVTIGGLTAVFSVATAAENLVDTIPDAFSFPAVTNATLATVTYSDEITLSGFDGVADLSIEGPGEYSVNGGVFTRNEGIVYPGDTVKVRQASSTYSYTTVSTRVTIGGLSSVFSVTTVDVVPDPFAFTPVTDVPDMYPVNSNTITVTGITAETEIRIADDPVNPSPQSARYSINNGAYTNQAGTVREGDTVKVLLVSSMYIQTTVSATLTIGGVSAVFSVTTF